MSKRKRPDIAVQIEFLKQEIALAQELGDDHRVEQFDDVLDSLEQLKRVKRAQQERDRALARDSRSFSA